MRLVRLAATFLAAVAVPVALALPAAATVNPTVIFNANAAGAFVALNANRQANGDLISGVRAEFFLLPSAQFDTTKMSLWHPSVDPGASPAKGGALIGVQLCRPLSFTVAGAAAVLFVQWNSGSGTFDVFAGQTLPNSLGVDCLGALGGVPNGAITQIDRIPAGHQVFLAITQGPAGSVTYTDADLTNDTGAQTNITGIGFFGFNRAGIGTNAGIDRLSANPSVKLARFTNDRVRDTAVGWGNIGSNFVTRFRTRLVAQATTPSDVFVSPDLNSKRLKLFRGTLTSP